MTPMNRAARLATIALAGVALVSAGAGAASAAPTVGAARIDAAERQPHALVPPTTGTHTLTNALIPDLADAGLVTDLGAVPASDTFQVTVHLAENQAAEAAAFGAVTNPRSPDYRHYLTVAQYVAEFGEPAAVTAAVASQLTAHGLQVVYTSAPGTLLDLRGTAAQMEATFDTSLHTYRTASGHEFRANTAQPTVPTAVDAVDGLETLSAPQLSQACAPGEPLPGVGCSGAITPQDLWSVYDQPSSDEGAGEQIGIIGAGQADTVISDLRGFESTHGLRQVPVRVVSAGDTYSYSAGEGEWALDSSATTGMAPDIDRLTYYFGDALGDDAAFSAFADDDSAGAPFQANYSVGGCEALNYALGTITAEEPIFRQMAMEGKTLFVSTGDTGGSCTVATGNGFANTGAPQVEWPSSSDAVVAVGGTELFTNGAEPDPTREVEKAWDFTGGGSSDFVQEPSWQSAITTIIQPCASEAVTSTGGGTFCRGVPDVAALSGDISVVAGDEVGDNALAQGYTDYEGATETSEGGTITPGAATVDGGTSLASPLWVGMWTRMQAAHGGDLGFAAPILYSVGENPTEDASDFYDIAIGQNVQHQAIPRTAGIDPTGWDYVSGLGVPDVGHLETTLDGTTVDSAPVDTADEGTVTRVDANQIAPASCTENGAYSDPTGDVSPTAVATSTQAVDLTGTQFTEPTSGTVHITNEVVDLTDSVDSLYFTNAFVYDGVDYLVSEERDEPEDAATFTLYSVDPTSTVSSTTTLGTLTGTFDDATNTVSVDLPISTFNSDASPAEPLADGQQLTGLTTTSNTVADEEIDYDDEASTPCAYVVGAASGVPTSVPEAPYLPLLLLLPAAPALVLLRRRRFGRPQGSRS
jgi:pseudomonalisin